MEIPVITLQQVPSHSQIIQDFYSIDISESEEVSSPHIKKPIRPRFDESFQTILEGFLPKKTLNFVWQDRYFCLTSTRLLYFTSPAKNELKGCFNFASLHKFQLQLKEEDNVLTILATLPQNQGGSMRELIRLNFEKKHPQLLQWKNALTNAIHTSYSTLPGQAPEITPTELQFPQSKVNGFNFWNKIYISALEFESYAHHFDIIFFRSRNPTAAFHRLMMRSHFDHVGLLFKDELDRVYILEAIESRGVWVNEWSELLPVLRESYEQIAYKKLILGSNQKLDYEQVEAYLNTVIGKKYELSLSKLLISDDDEDAQTPMEDNVKVESQENDPDLNNKQKNTMENKKKSIKIESLKQLPGAKQKTFFCSELIADLYIKFGLIRGKKRHEFWPMDFEGNLRLEGGAQLSPLMEIQF